MLFILVMEILHKLFTAAARADILARPPIRALHHQCNIYADDVMLFISPSWQDLVTTREVLAYFGNASGLRTNMEKCTAVPIACAPEDIARVQYVLPVPIAEFPITYLGLPLSVTKLRKTHFQPIIDRVTRSMPTWKSKLMNKAGRLTTVKAVMSAKPVHLMISLKVPDWVFQEMDKRRRAFLWAGKETASGGQCMVAWSTVCQPLHHGGLGIQDFKFAAYALRLRWLWLQRTDASRPWHDLDLAFGRDHPVTTMFTHSTDINLGDGHLALFWNDRWLGSNSPCLIAPDLCKVVKPRVLKSRTVAQALASRAWIQDIAGSLDLVALRQYVLVWHSTLHCQLRMGVEDVITWRWSTAGTYSARSAYSMFFEGATTFPAAKPLWKAWAPLKVKFTMWLAMHERLWTAERRFRHGLQDSPVCALCDQEQETCDHLFHACGFTRQIWHRVATLINLPAFTNTAPKMVDWWL